MKVNSWKWKVPVNPDVLSEALAFNESLFLLELSCQTPESVPAWLCMTMAELGWVCLSLRGSRPPSVQSASGYLSVSRARQHFASFICLIWQSKVCFCESRTHPQLQLPQSSSTHAAASTNHSFKIMCFVMSLIILWINKYLELCLY